MRADLQSEERLIYELLKALRQSAKGGKKEIREQFPEVPLRVLPGLREAARPTQQSKPRIAYSHIFVGVSPPSWLTSREASDTSVTGHVAYQAWMKVRVQEGRAAGRTHQAAIEAAIAEWGTGGNVDVLNP